MSYLKRVDWQSHQPIYPRALWRPERPRLLKYIDQPATAVFFTYTRTSPCTSLDGCCHTIHELQQKHMYQFDTAVPDIKYNFLIGSDGRAYTGRGWRIRPTLPIKWSLFSKCGYYIAFIGSFDNRKPSDAMFEAQDCIIKFGVYNKYIAPKFLEFTLEFE